MTNAINDMLLNLQNVIQKINDAARRSGRDPSEVTLVAVTKEHPIEMVKATIEAGVKDIGESYVNELIEKVEVADFKTCWHYIGHLQKNKVNKLIGYCPEPVILIHSVDSLELAEKVSSTAEREGKIIPILVQVNLAGEESKFGTGSEEVKSLVEQILKLKYLKLEGLMTIPPYPVKPEDNRPYFVRLRKIKNQLEKNFSTTLPHLSMGMSDDFEVAIEEGSTIVRIGTAIYGRRINENL